MHNSTSNIESKATADARHGTTEDPTEVNSTSEINNVTASNTKEANVTDAKTVEGKQDVNATEADMKDKTGVNSTSEAHEQTQVANSTTEGGLKGIEGKNSTSDESKTSEKRSAGSGSSNPELLILINKYIQAANASLSTQCENWHVKQRRDEATCEEHARSVIENNPSFNIPSTASGNQANKRVSHLLCYCS